MHLYRTWQCKSAFSTGGIAGSVGIEGCLAKQALCHQMKRSATLPGASEPGLYLTQQSSHWESKYILYISFLSWVPWCITIVAGVIQSPLTPLQAA